MKIKVALLEQDKNYLMKISNVFTGSFSDKLILYGFTSMETALDSLEKEGIDVFLASENFQINTQLLPKRCGFAYFVESKEIGEYENQKAICKFQRAELIYKELLGIFAEVSTTVSGVKKGDSQSNVIGFVSASGGTGSSTVAAACAMNLSSQGYKTLYLNFEQFGVSEVFFEAEGQSDFSDVIYQLKSRKSNLALKLESVVKRDVSDVYFFDSCKIALDMLGLTLENFEELMNVFLGSGNYSHIVLDMEFNMSHDTLHMLKNIDYLVFVSDGSEISNIKLQRAGESVRLYEKQKNITIGYEKLILYNKFSNKTSAQLQTLEMTMLGGIPTYAGADKKQIAKQISNLDVFRKFYSVQE